MPKIFLSYRRDDSPFAVAWIDKGLREKFGRKSIIRDIDTFPLGRDFRKVIERETNTCDIFLAVIGDNWLDVRYINGEKSGQRKIDDPEDFVRLEIEAALARDIPVIPVLVDHANLPNARDLPDTIQKLIFQGAAEVRSGLDLEIHINRLISRISNILEASRRRRLILMTIFPVIIGVIILAIFLYNSQSEWDDLPPEITNSLGMEFVLIPAGDFTMGSPDSVPNALDDEKPVHQVTISEPFYMGKYEVKQSEWLTVMGTNPSEFIGEKRPVENVSWNEIGKFIKKLNEKEDQEECRLPTEAEWEYAARAEMTTIYNFGDDPAQLRNYAWYVGNAGGETHPVGQKKNNNWGLFDMHGNVFEWVMDRYAIDYYKHDPIRDPKGPDDGALRVLRGGSWSSVAKLARSANRESDTTDYSFSLK